MQVLCINGYENTKRGADGFHEFVVSTMSCLRDSIKTNESLGEHNVIKRRINNLTDYVVDWEHDILDEKARHACHIFDKLDLVCIGGDMKVFPWDPLCSQVVTLLHMCNKTSKPTICCGSGGFMMVYASATAGKRFYMLNGPDGQSVDKLPYFPRYASTGGTSGAYPSGWLDNETGDVYSFDSYHKQWNPVCNIGMMKLKSGNSKPLPHEKKYARNDHVLTAAQKPECMLRESVAHIRSHQYTQHHENAPLSGIPSQSFVVSLLPDWHLNWDGSLPTLGEMQIVADGPHGPVVLFMNNKLILACEFKEGPNFGPLRRILVNFFEDMVTRMKMSPVRIDSSLTQFLFQEHGRMPMTSTLRTRKSTSTAEEGKEGNHGSRPAGTPKTPDFRRDRLKTTPHESPRKPHPHSAPHEAQQVISDHLLVMASSLACTAIPTKLPNGPTKVEIPNMTVFFAGKEKTAAPKPSSHIFLPQELKKTPPDNAIHNLNSEIVFGARRSSSTVGRPLSSRSIQNPTAFRRHRLETLMKDSGLDIKSDYNQHLLNDTVLESRKADPYGLAQQMPSSAREHYAGVYNPQTDSQNANLKHRSAGMSPNRASSASRGMSADPGVTPSACNMSPGASRGRDDETTNIRTVNKGDQIGHSWRDLFAQPIEEDKVDRVPFSGPATAAAVPSLNVNTIVEDTHARNHRTQSSSWKNNAENINLSRKEGSNSTTVPLFNKVQPPPSPIAIPTIPKLSIPVTSTSNYLPIHHPLSARSAGVSVGDDEVDVRECLSARAPPVGIHLRSPNIKPFNNIKKFTTMVNNESKRSNAPYEGAYHECYQSSYERDLKSYRGNKDKFVGDNNFNRYFGKASQIPLREEGGIRGHGPYDVDGVYAEDKSKRIQRPWVPSV